MNRARRVLVTGSSRGPGSELALMLAECGAEVILNSRDADILAEACGDTDGRLRALAFDVTDDDGVAAAFDWCAAHWGAPDMVVHAVGARVSIMPAELSQDAFEQALRLTLSGVLNVVDAAARTGVPRVVVLLPADPGFARNAVLALVTSLAGAWPDTQVLAATARELTPSALARLLDG